jgi:hypothetical protein
MAKQLGNKGGNATKAAQAGNTTAQATTVSAPTVVQAGQPTAPGILQVKPGVALRGARAAWYAALLAYNGKPVAEFLAATDQTGATPTGKAPSVPKSGTAEKPSGWLGWFTRSGIATVVQPGATPTP